MRKQIDGTLKKTDHGPGYSGPCHFLTDDLIFRLQGKQLRFAELSPQDLTFLLVNKLQMAHIQLAVNM